MAASTIIRKAANYSIFLNLKCCGCDTICYQIVMRHYDGSSKLLQTMFLCFYIVYSRMYSNIFSKKIYSEHKALLKRTSAQGIAKRHIEHFVGWFEYKVSIVIIYLTKKYCTCPLFKYFISFFSWAQANVLYEEQKISEELYDFSQGPHYVARVFSRCLIHVFSKQLLSRLTTIHKI
jgi:hypothetical protein